MPDLLEQQRHERTRYAEAVIQSPAEKKIIVAGPGTGKTYAFQGVCRARPGPNLALTFINNLADDLAVKLEDCARSQTFHSYCKGQLHRLSVSGISNRFVYFPFLPEIVRMDGIVLKEPHENFSEAFQSLIEDDGRIGFYLERADYYDAVGHDDAVYRALRHLRAHEDEIERFSQIVVDEYQDFNALEIAMIDLLERYSPVLIVGDDDQALYERLKHASVEYIRRKSTSGEYERFELPYSSRCTEVVIGSVHDVVRTAQTIGRLQERIERQYRCYLPDKQPDCQAYPKIIHAACSTQGTAGNRNYIGRYIEQAINQIPGQEEQQARQEACPLALIIGPGHYLKSIHTYLKDKVEGVTYSETRRTAMGLEDGYEILLGNEESNLGWRVVLEMLDPRLAAQDVINSRKRGGHMLDTVPKQIREKHSQIIRLLARLRSGESLLEQESRLLQSLLGDNYVRVVTRFSPAPSMETTPARQPVPRVLLTTRSGSKGLQASFVFVVGLNDGEFPTNPRNPTDREIREFIVALTRTCKQCHLISNRLFERPPYRSASRFINWLEAERVEHIRIDRNYWGRSANNVVTSPLVPSRAAEGRSGPVAPPGRVGAAQRGYQGRAA